MLVHMGQIIGPFMSPTSKAQCLCVYCVTLLQDNYQGSSELKITGLIEINLSM